ncbi:allene oxide cyclase barrel-like domain-containing protein [Parafrankia sp. FMc2]|uniref:allene oxide cyclase barrel-like domain-containing protein n=1 Tax=Parafrankia sp. FMc2 TaxID=3233196 RepID=UPI0034D4D9EB
MSQHPSGLIIIGPLTEVTTELKLGDGVLGAPKVGDYGTYQDDLIDADDKKIGEVFGRAEGVYQRPSDGHLFSWYVEDITLPDGTATYEGPLDVTAAQSSVLLRFPIVGTGGRYEGLLGVREARVLNPKLYVDVRFVFFPEV